MLRSSPQLQAVFLNPETGQPKAIECICVDGAGDEGPSHLEVQYLWTAHHLEWGTMATLVSTRCSGCSYLNRVELQNGCLALAHSNLFIPSTLNGSCMDMKTGCIDKEKLRVTLMQLQMCISTLNGSCMDMKKGYIGKEKLRSNHTLCGNTQIILFKGAQTYRQNEML